MGVYEEAKEQVSRLENLIEILDSIPHNVKSILDIGIGTGVLSRYFLQLGAEVIGTHTDDTYDEVKKLNDLGIKTVKCWVDNMPFQDGQFDAVLASNILEHVYDWQKSLSEIHRVLKPKGTLYLLLPSYSEYVCCGHINTGWNLGQIMYVLIQNGFSVKDGKYLDYQGNLCAVVSKIEEPLPAVPEGESHIHFWSKQGLFPPISNTITGNPGNGFWGDFKSYNWPRPEQLRFYQFQYAEKYNLKELKNFDFVNEDNGDV